VELPDLAEGTRQEVRGELGLDEKSPVAIATARLHPSKGHEHLLEASALVVKHFPETRPVIVGDGPRRNWLEARATERVSRRTVIFTGSRRDVLALSAASDLFVLPSLLGGMPYCLLKAMAVGLLVVATSVCGIPAVVEDSRNGLLVPPRNPAALASAVCRILREPGFAHHLATEAKMTV